ncbi:hypothetical protein DPMN_144914 [Dreissena polymorpha]|uniref:Uncharacterized protein n=1 Tax=Dreissena polymorpha TaxID=45954 RepID=A0A9D4F5P6_DREPO|nr:hypothetical protein DPMN_144914 [Dreissena polymorpha]
MLDPNIYVPLERIYVSFSIKELRRSQVTHKTSSRKTNLSCYNELLSLEGNRRNTICILGDPGCGKTTFLTNLVVDLCKAQSKNSGSIKNNITPMVTTSKQTSKQTLFSDLDCTQFVCFGHYVITVEPYVKSARWSRLP